jgi:hypothetical protein
VSTFGSLKSTKSLSTANRCEHARELGKKLFIKK